MNKHLLLGSALLVAISAYPQNGRLVRPTGAIERAPKKIEYNDFAAQGSVIAGPVKNNKSNLTAKVTAVTASRITGSMNVFGYLVSTSRSLSYNKGVNTVSFVHRKSGTYTAASNSNSGTIVAMIGANAAATWDSTCIWTNGTNLARYPQGGIYNPLGNTNKNNAYVVGMGPITGGSGWLGNWYASKTLNGAGTNAPGTGSSMQAFLNATPTLKVHHFSRYSFSSIDGGLVRSMGTILNDPAGTTNVTYGVRGAVMVKGQFNAGAFVWSVDSFVPPVNSRTDGSKLVVGESVQAWNNAGTIGYVVMLGSRSGTGNTTKGYQPIVYKTTNSGASWSLLPANDFTTNQFKGLTDRLYPVNNSTAVICPNFSGSEGNDAVVDANGNLHYTSMVYGHYSNHVDSLGYRYTFGTEQYSYDYSGAFGYPTIYDFYTTSAGGWKYHIVDSMGTEGPSGTSGQPGYNTNPWSDGSGGKMALDARLQMSRTDDGAKVYYSWSESDSAIVGLKWNAYPDIKMKGYDVATDKLTGRINVSGGVTGADQQAYYQYMCDRAIGTSTACTEVPFTITYNGTNDGSVPVNTYYLKGNSICAASFTANALHPTAVSEIAKENVTFNVMNFPNPANGATTILVGLKDAANFDVAIYNAVGQVVDTYKVNGQAGANEIHIDLSKFAAGVYVYNVKVGNTTVTKKLIVE